MVFFDEKNIANRDVIYTKNKNNPITGVLLPTIVTCDLRKYFNFYIAIMATQIVKEIPTSFQYVKRVLMPKQLYIIDYLLGRHFYQKGCTFERWHYYQ